MSIKIQEPLFLLSAQTGMSAGDLTAEVAEGNPQLGSRQVAMKTGEPIPLIFCRRRNNNGGVLVQPKATEGYFSNTLVTNIFRTGGSGSDYEASLFERFFIKYLLVLSEGDLAQLQVRDVFFGNSRVGTCNQTYDGRAGTWDAGNNIGDYVSQVIDPEEDGSYDFDLTTLSVGQTVRLGDTIYRRVNMPVPQDDAFPSISYRERELPIFTGTSGTYNSLTTLSFEYAHDLGEDQEILKPVSCFVREGAQVTRLVDATLGPSDNFVDLVKRIFQANNRLADDLINDAALTIAAKFTDANGFLFNGSIDKSQNLLDWMQATSVNFLLQASNSNGKLGLRPRLPYNTDYTIKTTEITPKFTFTEEHILPGGFQVEYISLEDREPVCFVVQWRQQPEADFGLVRTVQVRYEGEAANGPFVDIDMSAYCTNEDHAVKVGTYRLAQRKFVTHHLRLTVRERNYNVGLTIGDLVRVRLRRETSEGQVEYHDKIYEINRIEKTFAASIVYDLTHFPIDALGRSIVAREVDAATGAGNTIDVGRNTFDGDSNSSTDTTPVGTASGGGGVDSEGNSIVPGSADTSVEIAAPVNALVDDNGDPVFDADGNQLTVEDASFPGGLEETISDGSNDQFGNPTPDLTEDPIDEPLNLAATIGGSNTGYGGSSATPGNTVNVAVTDLPCANGRVCYYRVDKATGERTLRECVTSPVSGNYSSSITTADINYAIVAEGQCPDPSSPDGFGQVVDFGETDVVVPDPEQYSYVRFSGTIETFELIDGERVLVTNAVTTAWQTYDNTTQDPYMTIGSTYTGVGIAATYQIMDSYFNNPYTDALMFAQWTPWVNYFNTNTSEWVGDNNVYSVPWRSHVEASAERFFGGGNTGIYLGGLASSGYGLGASPNPVTDSFSAYLPPESDTDTERRTIKIDGSWEFSDDESVVLASWKGTDDSGNPYVDSSE